MTKQDATLDCPQCDKRCCTNMKLNKHITDVHSQKVKCECCDKIFTNKDTMRAHLKNLKAKPVRPEIPKEEQTCEECGKLFNSKKSI